MPDLLFECGMRFPAAPKQYNTRYICPEHGRDCHTVGRFFICDECKKEYRGSVKGKINCRHTCPTCKPIVKSKDNKKYQQTRRDKSTLARWDDEIDPDGNKNSYTPHEHIAWDKRVDPVNGRLPGCYGLTGEHRKWETEGFPLGR
jgi:hypothetical protein